MDYTTSLPSSNRTTEVMAAVFNQFVSDAKAILAVPSTRQGEEPFPEPPYIRTFSLLELCGLTVDRAIEVDRIIHDRVWPSHWSVLHFQCVLWLLQTPCLDHR